MEEVRPIDGKLLVYHLATEQLNAHPLDYNTNATYAECMKRVDAMPTLDYAPVRHGEWVEQEDFCGDPYYTCSACKIDWVCIDGTPAENRMRYCPNCGAKMDGGNTDA